MIPAQSAADFKEFTIAFIASVKSGKRYDFRGSQNLIIPQRFLSPSPLTDLTNTVNFNYHPEYKVPYSDELLYKVGTTVRTSDFFMDLQYAIINGKDVETVCFEGLSRIKPFSIMNAKLKDRISPPIITKQPTDQVVVEGETITVNLTETGSTTFQWYFNNLPLSNKTNRDLIIENSTIEDSGSYYVVCSNTEGSVKSNVISVEVNLKPSPTGEKEN